MTNEQTEVTVEDLPDGTRVKNTWVAPRQEGDDPWLVGQSAILDYTVGRATNDDLEKTVAVWFKDEGDDGQESVGPIYLELDSGHMIPLRRGADAEWHADSTARELAKELGVEVKWS